MALIKAAIYARFSSDNQRDESIDAQIRAAAQYAERNGMQVVKEYIDRARSATTDRRPQFQQMISDSSKGIFEALIIHKIDRFSRDRYDSINYKRILKKNRVRLYSVTENLDGSPEAEMLESMLESLAAFYSRNLAREVMKGLTENALKCKHTGGKPPLGYDVDPESRRYIINEREAEVVREIFDLYLAGFGYDKIVTELNAKRRLTKLNKPFGKNSLHDILVNEKYAGVYVFNRAASKNWEKKRNTHETKNDEDVIRIPGGVPAIVSREVFDKIQEKMRNNKRQPGAYKAKEVYLLSGLIICGECMTRESKSYAYMGNCKHSGRNKIKHVTYRCSNRERAKQCDNKEIRREYIEAFVLGELQKNIFSEKAIPYLAKKLNEFQEAQVVNRSKEQEILAASINELTNQINNIVAMVINGHNSSALGDKLRELEARKAVDETALRELQIKQKTVGGVTEEVLRGVLSMFKQFVAEKNVLEIRKFIASYIKQVIVYKDRVIVVFLISVGDNGQMEPYQFSRSISRVELIRHYGQVA